MNNRILNLYIGSYIFIILICIESLFRVGYSIYPIIIISGLILGIFLTSTLKTKK